MNLGVKDAYTKPEAQEEIDLTLSAYHESCTFKYYPQEVNITDGYLVRSRRDRLKVCAVISRCGVTDRSPENLAAEWLIHNVSYRLNIGRASAVDVALDYVKDRRWVINAATKLLELLRIY